MKRHTLLGTVLTVLLAIGLLSAIPASANKTHLFKEVFGSAQQPSFPFATGLAVSQSNGDVLVVGSNGHGNWSVTRWKPNGEPDPFPALGTNSIDGAVGPGGKTCAEEAASCDSFSGGLGPSIAVTVDGSSGPASGDIYVAETEVNRVVVFAADGSYLGQLTKFGTKNFGELRDLAVDPGGNLYVSDGTKRAVHKFTPTSNPPTSASFAGDITAVERNDQIAAGSGPTAGYLFIARHTGSVPEFSGGIFKVKIATGEVQYPVVEGLVSSTNSDPSVRKLAVDPATGHLFVSTSESLDEYDVSGASGPTQLSSTRLLFNLGASGLGVRGSTGDIYGTFAEKIQVFGPAIATLPEVLTGAAGGITPSRAVLHGTVDPDGQELTECFFEYGEEVNSGPPATFGNSIPCTPAPAAIGSGTTAVPVEAHLSGLPAGKGFYFRISAANSNNVPIVGSSHGFTTAHAAVTTAATAVTATGAELRGTVNPDGTAIDECVFEYGVTAAPYESSAPCAESAAEIGSGEAPVPVHLSVAGLEAGVTYHFRLSTTTAAASDHGQDVTFATLQATETLPATEVGGSSGTLNGSVIPGSQPVGECFFQYVEDSAYEPLAGNPYGAGTSAPCAESEAEIGTGFAPAHVHAVVSDLEVGVTYHFRLVAGPSGAAREGSDLQFSTGGPRLIAQWAESVTVSEATVAAQLDTQGSATTYHVEWGPTSSPYANSTAEVAAGNGIRVSISGLEAGSVYHYRFVASSHCNPAEPAEVCETAGPDHTFTTYRPLTPQTGCSNQEFRIEASSRLPDCRAFEMVSPLEKNGGNVAAAAEASTYRPLAESAADGNRATFSSLRAFAEPQSSPLVSQYLATRTPQGWTTKSISLPRFSSHRGGGIAAYGRFEAFTEDLCSSWVFEDTSDPLVPAAPAGYANLYRQNNCASAPNYELLSPTIPTGIEPEAELLGNILGAQGFSGDLAHTVIASIGGLTANACPTQTEVFQLYESYDGGSQVRLVSILPNGEPSCLSSTVGSPTGNFVASANAAMNQHAVSPDGSTIYWTSGAFPAHPLELYVRINANQEQSAVAGGECTEPEKACTLDVSQVGGAQYWDAASDGSRALYTLGGPSAGGGLFEYDLASRSSQQIATGVEGVVGASQGLGRIYFISRDVLSGSQQNGQGAEARSGRPNLYFYEGGDTIYIATLSSLDTVTPPVGGAPAPDGLPERRNSRVSADGLHLAFATPARLTEYENTDTASGEEATEVYLYDAATGPSGQLHCISCSPSGARPQARRIGSTSNQGFWSYAANLPGWAESQRASRLLSDDGNRLFFESVDPLVLSDTNGKKDVYEWQRGSDVAACEAVGAEAFVATAGGCISLISSGHSDEDSELVDASAGGRDVFLTTASSLSAEDPGLIDLYDAREGGGFPRVHPAAACEGEACQGPVEPPRDPTPASSSFEGAGNVKQIEKSRCAKGKARRKGRCVKEHKAKKRHAAKKRAKHERRAGR